MKGRAKQIVLVALTIGALWAAACSAPADPVKNASTGNSTARAAAAVRISEDATVLPDPMATDDPETLFRAMLNSEKSQFETTADYKARLAKEAKETVYTFIVKPLSVTFDADRSEFAARLLIASGASTTDIDEHGVIIAVDQRVTKSTWPAKNAFGTTVTVIETKTVTFGISASPLEAVEYGKRIHSVLLDDRYKDFVELRTTMPPSDAKAVIEGDSIRFLVRSSLAVGTKKRTYAGAYTWKATLDHPTQRTDEAYATYVDIANIRVWLIDIGSRRVLSKTTFRKLLGYK